MPTKNPRLSVVLPPAVAATLAAIAEETGDSASSLVRGLVEQSHPALQRMLQLVRAAKSARGQISGGVAAALDRVVDDLHDAVAVADARAGRALGDLVAEAEQVQGRRRPRRGLPDAGSVRQAAAPAVAAPTPGPVTRGSGRLTPGRKGARRG